MIFWLDMPNAMTFIRCLHYWWSHLYETLRQVPWIPQTTIEQQNHDNIINQYINYFMVFVVDLD